jgi:hypothetical protein
MRHARPALVLGIALGLGCSGSDDEGYDGPGKDLVGEWIADGTHQVSMAAGNSSVGGTNLFRIYVEGEHLFVEDGACAFPGLGDGNARISLMESDSCVRNDVTGEALTYIVESGAATVAPGDHFSLQISGRVRAVAGEVEGTFSIVYVGEPAGEPCTDCDDDGNGDPDDGSGGGGGS